MLTEPKIFTLPSHVRDKKNSSHSPVPLLGPSAIPHHWDQICFSYIADLLEWLLSSKRKKFSSKTISKK